jgi:hypothetical protein
MGWKGPYFRINGRLLDNGIIPEFDITYEDFVDAWGSPLQVPFQGDDIFQSFGAVYDPNFGNVTTGNPAYDSTYNMYSGILLSGGPNKVINSALDTVTYLDPSGVDATPEYPNDDIWTYINKNEVMANFASSGNISRANDSGYDIQVNTGLNIWFHFPAKPDFDPDEYMGIKYTVKSIAMIFPDQAEPFGFDVKLFRNLNYAIDSVNDDNTHTEFTKDNLDPVNSMSIEQVYVPLGTCHFYALIEANNKSKMGTLYFESSDCIESNDDPEWALSHPNRWGSYLDMNMEEDNNQLRYGIFYAPLEIEHGSGSYTVSIPVNIASVVYEY